MRHTPPIDQARGATAPLFVPEVFSPAECAQVIEIAEAAAFADAGLVRGQREDNIRRARIVWLEESRRSAWVFDRLIGVVTEANRSHFGFALTEFAERAQIAWYDAGQGGHFDWHVDIGDGALARRRKLTLVVQLTDDAAYEGGTLELNPDGAPRPAPRAQGAAALFPSFVLHRVAPVTASHRYSLTTWVHGPPFR